MIEEMQSWPFAWAWLAFFAVAFFRAGGTYLIGRLAAAGLIRRREPGPGVRRAMAQIDRWGAPAVAASFLTVGAQTVINFSAGLATMSVPRYLSGLVPGAAIWGTIWATIGMTAFYAVFSGGGNRAAWLVLFVLVIVLAVLVSRSVRARA